MTRWLHFTLFILGVALTGCTSGGMWPFGGSGGSSPYSASYPSGPGPGEMSLNPATVTPPSSFATPTSPTSGLASGTAPGTSFVEQPAPTTWQTVTAPFTSAAAAVGGAFNPAQSKSDPTSINTPANKVSAPTYVSYAKICEERKDLGKAEHFYQKAIETDPKDLLARISYGRMCFRQKQFEKAATIYRDAITLDPNNPVAYNDLGFCYATQGKVMPAIESLSRAVQLEPTNKLYRSNTAMVLVEANRPEEALAQLLAVHPTDIAHYNLGYLLSQKGDHALASQHLAKALEANPNLIPARQMLAKLHSANDAIARRPDAPFQPQGPFPPQGPAQPQGPAWPAGQYGPGTSGIQVSNPASAPANPAPQGPAFAPAGYQTEQSETLPPVN